MLEEDFKCVPQGILNILSAALGEEVIFCQIYIYMATVLKFADLIFISVFHGLLHTFGWADGYDGSAQLCP